LLSRLDAQADIAMTSGLGTVARSQLRSLHRPRPRPGDSMLAIRNLSKTYANGVQALKDITLEIPNGMFGLLGPNGAGKSTLMRTIATLQDPDSGSIHLDDIDVLADKQTARQTLGYGTITLTVDGEPYEAGIDPYNKLVDRNSNDNRKKVTLQ